MKDEGLESGDDIGYDVDITALWDSEYWLSVMASINRECIRKHGKPLGIYAYETEDMNMASEFGHVVRQHITASKAEDEMSLDDKYYHQWNQDDEDDFDI